MRHLAAYLLLVASGVAAPTEADITKVLSSVGIEVDQERLTQMMTELEGKDLNELIATGEKKLCKGGAVAAAGAAPAAAAGGAAAPAEAAAPAKPKEEEVDALEGGMDMFGGGGSDY